jgi:two-component system LytT family response regulator
MQPDIPIRVIIVDDEKPARDRIRHLLAHEMDVEIVAEYGDALQAANALNREPPDLLFLDVQMPELDGVQLLRDMRARSGMHVIFVTAYAEHALSAFDLDAADYLLKPFDPDRFAEAVDRVRALLRQARVADEQIAARDVLRGIGANGARPQYPDHIPVRAGHDIVLVKTESVDWIEAMGNYARLHVGTTTHMLRESMQKLETVLDPARFVRVHRSTIVNVDRIQKMRPMYHGEFEIVLTTGATVMMSRSYKDRLRERWGHWL